MSQTYPLDPIIRILDSLRPPDNPLTEKVIIIDANNGDILEKEPGFFSSRNPRSYLVSTQNIAECKGPICHLREFETGHEINIDITYSARCERGREEGVVRALYNGDNPVAVLNGFIHMLIEELRRTKEEEGTSLIQNYFHLRGELEEHIRSEVLDKIGLYLNIKLAVEHENDVKPLLIDSETLVVRVRDCDDELAIRLKTELQIDEANKINAILNRDRTPELKALVKEYIEKSLSEDFTLHELCYKLQSEVRNKLIEGLNKLLLSEGRNIGFLSVERMTELSLPAQSSQIEHDVACDVKGYQDQINVNYKLLVNLEDVGKYRMAEIDDLETSLKDRLDNVTQTMLFDKTYIDLCLNFDDTEIRLAVEKEIMSIGYATQNLEINLLLPLEDNLKPFQISSSNFPINVTNHSDELSLRVEAELRTDEQYRENAIRCHNRLPILEAVLTEQIKKFFLASVTIHQFCYELNGSVRDELIQDLDEILINEGRRITSLYLESPAVPSLPLKPFPIASDNFVVRVKDYPGEILNLKFETELGVKEDAEIDAILSHDQLQELKVIFIEQIKMFLVEYVTLHQFCYELEDEIRDRLIETLDKVLINQGRRIVFLSLKAMTDFPLPDAFKSIEQEVICKVDECEVPVKNTLIMNLEDIGKYRNAEIDDLQKWVAYTLGVIAQNRLFDKEYIDLILDFDPEGIKTDMEKEAEKIGYTIKQHVVLPNLAPLIIQREGFKIETEENYATNDTRVDVKLSIVVTGKIGNLQDIKEYLYPQIDIEEEIKKAIHDETTRFMHSIEPERFYMRFMSSPNQEEKPVTEDIRDKIVNRLTTQFSAEQVNVIPKAVDTDLSGIIRDLQMDTHDFEVEAVPRLSGESSEPVTYRGSFEVITVSPTHGWHTFQARFQSSDSQSLEKPSDRIKQVLQKAIKIGLNAIPANYLQFTKFADRNTIIETCFNPAVELITKIFGLEIQLFNINRDETASGLLDRELSRREKEIRTSTHIAMVEFREEYISTELKQLYEQLLELNKSETPEDDPERQRILRRIADIETDIPSSKVQLQLPSAESSPEFSFDDFSTLRLEAHETPDQPTNEDEDIMDMSEEGGK